MPSERQAIARNWGKWSLAGVPHKGWYCVSEFDAIEECGSLLTCEMCERAEVRFVHVMEHDDYPDRLNCGCICATHLSDEKVQTIEREKRMRSRASRRGKFAERKSWRTSARGNPHIKVDGVHVVIARSRDGKFHVGSKLVTEDGFEWDTTGHATESDAKTASFDLVERLGLR